MTILDRFRAQPGQRHADPAVRLAFVQDVAIDQRALLAEIAREDEDPRVRKAAVAKLMDPAALASVAAADADQNVRDAALWMLRDIALDAFEGIPEADSLAAVDVLTDQKTLAGIAKTAVREEVALRALSRINDPRAHGSIARHAQVEPVRLAALAALEDRGEILNVALNSEFKDTAVTAVERLVERGELEQVDARAKNKSAVKRARAVIREMDDRATAAAEVMRAAELEVARLEQGERDREQAARDAEERAAAEAAAQARAAALAEEEAQRQAARTVAEQEADASRALEEAEAAQRREEEAAVARQRAEEEAERTRQRQAEQAEAQERDARARRDALTRVQQLAARIEPLPAKADLTLKAGERALRDLRAALADIPPLPSRKDYEEIVARLKAAQAALTPKVHEMREAVEWQRWANVGVQEQLCQKMEALAAVEDAEAVARQVKELQEQWRQVSDVPRQQGDALWRRFKAAHDVAWDRCAAYFAEQAEVRAANLAKKITLCEQAEALGSSSDWIRTAEAIKGLQAEWKVVGPVSRGQEKAIWERFRVACDQFFTRRQVDLVERKAAWTANMAKKEALCARVEALADSTEWEAASAEIKRLQAEWKTVGPVKRSRSDAIWQRFRGACDRFFGRYAQRHDLARTERVAAREAICAELEALSPVAIEEASAAQEPSTAEASESPGNPGNLWNPGNLGNPCSPRPPREGARTPRSMAAGTGGARSGSGTRGGAR